MNLFVVSLIWFIRTNIPCILNASPADKLTCGLSGTVGNLAQNDSLKRNLAGVGNMPRV